MSGHSKWHSIKHQKAKEDQKRGKIFSKIVREITIAAKIGGGEPGMNPRLRLAIDKANEANMPKDNIEKAIKRGTGELPGVSYTDVVYEGYGPGGVAVMVQAATDNKNRTASEIRRIFADHSGNLGETGCVSWMFKKKGYISISKKEISEDALMELVIELDVEDIKTEDDEYYEIITSPEKYSIVKDAIINAVTIADSEITMIPNTYIKLKGKDAKTMIRLMDDLEGNDDVQQVFANFDISSEEISKFEADS